MPISFRLEHVIEEVLSARPRDQKRALRKLAGVRLSTRNTALWPIIASSQ